MSQQEFEHYLSLLARMLRLTPQQRDAIADELRSHLEERLAELQAQGHDRDEAIRHALDEFGDANALAHDFTQTARHAAQRKTRRRLMQTTAGTFGVLIAAAAVTFAVMTLGPQRAATGPAPVHGQQATAENKHHTSGATPDQNDYAHYGEVEVPTQIPGDWYLISAPVLLVDANANARLLAEGEPLGLPGMPTLMTLTIEQVETLQSDRDQILLGIPGIGTAAGGRSTAFVGQQFHENHPLAPEGRQHVLQINRGLALGLVVVPAPQSPRLRISADLQTVWNESFDPLGDQPNYHVQSYGEKQPALPLGAGWSPGWTGVRFQLEAEPGQWLAFPLPIPASFFEHQGEHGDRVAWQLMRVEVQ